jgi:hypothetical protein
MLKSVTYSSIAKIHLTEGEIRDIVSTSRRLNEENGITGLLLFNGTFFLQIIEGEPAAVDELVERIRADERHSGMLVFDQRGIDRRFFPEWRMEYRRIAGSYHEIENIVQAIPEILPEYVRLHIHGMVQLLQAA